MKELEIERKKLIDHRMMMMMIMGAKPEKQHQQRKKYKMKKEKQIDNKQLGLRLVIIITI